MSSRSRTLRLGAATLVGVLAAAGLVAGSVAPANADDTTPPWQVPAQKDPNAVATLAFYDASGNAITSGSTTAPISAYAVSSGTVRAGDNNATLFAYTPNPAKAPGAWSGTQLSATRTFPVAGAPAGLPAGPAYQGTAGETTLKDHIAAFPNGSATTGYANVYELRLRTSSATKGVGAGYAVADVVVTGNTWTLYGTGAVKTDTSTAATVPTTGTYGTGFQVAATVTGGATPTGNVTLKEGSTTIGSAVALNGSGQATFNVSGTALAAGSHSLTVAYAGDSTHNASTSTASPITIAKAATSVTTTVPAKATYGTAYQVLATVTATGATPTGTVTLKSGATTVVSATLAAGKATLTVPGTTFAPGTRAFTVTYNESASFTTSTSAAKNTVVGKAVARAVNALSPKTIKQTKAAKLTVRVTAPGVVPTGKVAIYDGTRLIKTVTLTAANKGAIVATLPKLKKGKHKIHAVYLGSTLVNKATAATVVLTSTK